MNLAQVIMPLSILVYFGVIHCVRQRYENGISKGGKSPNMTVQIGKTRRRKATNGWRRH